MITILGDIHVGKGLSNGKPGIGSTPNSRVLDQLDLLDWTLEQTLANGGSHIITTGDVFEDVKPSPSLLAYFTTWLKKCEHNGISVHVIQGNHDMLRYGSTNTSSLDVIIESDLPSSHIYKDITTIYIGDVAITLVPFRDRKFFNLNSNQEAVERINTLIAYELASIPNGYRKILIGHLAIESAIYVGDEVDDVANELICPLSMFSGYDYVWMGHVHKPQVVQTKTPYRPHVAHIGSMDISNFKEYDDQKIIVLFDDTFQTLPLPTRPLRHFSIEVPANTKNTTEYVATEIKKQGLPSTSICRVEIHLGSPELLPVDRKELEKQLYDAGAFNIPSITECKPPSITKKASSILDTTMSVPASIKTWVENNVPQDKQSPTICLALDCYREYKENE
jgi:DNA repair exonuclease SbcCD nuclease subunit